MTRDWSLLRMVGHGIGFDRARRWLPELARRVDRSAGASHGGSRGQVVSRDDLDVDSFVSEMLPLDQPVVWKGAARAWPAMGRWSLEFFAEFCGDVPVTLMRAEIGGEPSQRDGGVHRLGDVLRAAMAGEGAYPRFVPLLAERPDLHDDLDLSWLRGLRGPGRGENLQLFLGGPGSSTALHAALGSNLFVQLHGRKKWTLTAPRSAPSLGVAPTRSPYFFSEVDLDAPVADELGLDVLEVELEAGDLLYNPPFWWHQVRNPTRSVGLGYRFYDVAAMLRASRTLTLCTLFATEPSLFTGARLKGDFATIFTGRYRG